MTDETEFTYDTELFEFVEEQHSNLAVFCQHKNIAPFPAMSLVLDYTTNALADHLIDDIEVEDAANTVSDTVVQAAAQGFVRWCMLGENIEPDRSPHEYANEFFDALIRKVEENRHAMTVNPSMAQ